MGKTAEPVRLIAFDLDGTVFGSPERQEVSPRLERAFRAAREAGTVLCAATGRPHWMLGEQLVRAPWLDWAIAANGAQVAPMRGAGTGAKGSETPIPRDLALELLDLLESYDAGFNAHLQARTLVQNWMPEQGGIRTFVEGMGTEGAANPIFSLFGMGLMAEVDSVADEMRADPSLRLDKVDALLPDKTSCDEASAAISALGGLEVARLSPDDIEITAVDVSKGAALGWLCSNLGIDETHAVAFGDSGNDLSMAGRANTFVAMGNASPEVKVAADETCGTVEKDGVAAWIEEHVLAR